MVSNAGSASTGWVTSVMKAAQGIRKRVFEHTLANNGGYLSQACGAAEILATLYLKTMHLGPSAAPMVPGPFPGVPGPFNLGYATGGLYNGVPGPTTDRFFLSPAHYALVLYAALIEAGRMAPEGLLQFNKDGSSVEMIGAEHSPGFSMMGGSLAQTLSQAAGIALARRLHGETGRTWVFLSDGEFQEGQTWETLSALSFYRLESVAVYIDVNGQQCDGETKNVMSVEPIDRRIEAFGGRVFVVDGHDPIAIDAPAGLTPDGRPLFVVCRTDPCRGIPLLNERRPHLHYVRFTSPEERERYSAWYESNMAPKGGK
ncbi:MAG: transketolase [Syntrophobacteraceae bacterium]